MERTDREFFFIHRSGDTGSEELHIPAKNISIEINDLSSMCDGYFVMIPACRKKPHGDRMRFITSQIFFACKLQMCGRQS